MTDLTAAHAKAIAAGAHLGQEDKQDRDYFVHHLVPIADGASVFGNQDVEDAAWLHDIIEDQGASTQWLTARGFNPVIVSAVDSVSERANEKYDDLIDRACADPVGRYVKLADNAWNILCNPEWKETDPEKAANKLERDYLPARVKLLEACGLTEDSPQYLAMIEKLKYWHNKFSVR